jgi:hypothetical protein
LHLLQLREPWFQCVHTWNNRAPELLPFCITPRLFFLTADRCVHLKISHAGQTAKMNTISLIYNKLFNVFRCSKMKQFTKTKFWNDKKGLLITAAPAYPNAEFMLQNITVYAPVAGFPLSLVSRDVNSGLPFVAGERILFY